MYCSGEPAEVQRIPEKNGFRITHFSTPIDMEDKKNARHLQMINPAVHAGSTVLFPNYDTLKSTRSGKFEGIAYGTDRLPVQREFESALCALEKGCLTRAFQSGISAIINTIMAFTKSGDHILLCENVYGPTASFCKKVLARFGVETGFYPGSGGCDIEAFLRPNTSLIFLESPGSNTFEIQDIRGIVQIAGEHGIVTAFDNTWATPMYLKPLDLGVDVSIQSVTKYISGHSDVLMGAVTVNERSSETLAEYYRAMELFCSPQDSYLALRGLQTLEVRLRQHEQAALELARWLNTRDEVELVLHPALAAHPQHELWKRDFKGSSGLFSIAFKKSYSESQVAQFVDALEMFGIGFSWGGFKSLVTAGTYRRPSNPDIDGRMLVRLNIGLEHTDDLQADLERGLAALK